MAKDDKKNPELKADPVVEPATDPVVEPATDPEANKAPTDVEGVAKFVTTDRIKVNGGDMRDPTTGITYSRGKPRIGEAYPGSWLESQMEAGFIIQYTPTAAVEEVEGQ